MSEPMKLYESSDEVAANLIPAAPSLYEALEALVESASLSALPTERALRDARAALALARGES